MIMKSRCTREIKHQGKTMLVVHLTECQGAKGGVRGIEDPQVLLSPGQNIHPWAVTEFEWSTI